MKRKGKYIGVFDSGFGGLDILREIFKELPQYNYIYLGDTARTPYGSRSQEVIYEFTVQAVRFLFKKDCELIIIACNTSSSEALRKIQRHYLPKKYPKKRVLGVIIPAAEKAVELTCNNRIGVIGTESTIVSSTFSREIKKLNPKVKVFAKACPLLVPLVEAGEERSRATNLILKNYLAPLIRKKIDTLVLGCTHYGLLKNKIKRITGKRIKIISEGKILATKLKDYLRRHPEIEKKLGTKRKTMFLTTDLTGKFKILGSKLYGKKIFPARVELI